MGKITEFTRAQLLAMAGSQNGGVIKTEELEKLSDARLLSMCHPLDVDREPHGW